MLTRLHEAHYLQGRRIADEAVLIELAREIGLDRSAFSSELAVAHGEAVKSHFAESRELLSRAGGRGFPTFLLERNGDLERLDHTQFLGRPEAWQDALRSMTVSTFPPVVTMEVGCGPNGCAI